MAHKPKDVYTNVKIEIMCASVRNFWWAIGSETNMPPKINKQTPQMNLAGDIFPAAACKMAFEEIPLLCIAQGFTLPD